MKKIYVLMFSIISICSWAQSVYKGRVVIQNELLHTITIENNSTGNKVESDSYGYFFIPASIGDKIVFKSDLIYTKDVIVTDSLLLRLKPVYLVGASTELKEIIIDEYDAHFLKLSEAQEKISNEIAFDPNMNIIGLINKGISLFRKKKPVKRISNDELNKIASAKPIKIDWSKNQRLSDLPDIFYIEKIDLPKHLIEQFIYFVTQTPQFSSWIDSEDENVLVAKLLEQKKWFLEYYNKR